MVTYGDVLWQGGGGGAARAASHAASSPTDNTNKLSHVLPNAGGLHHLHHLHPDQPVLKQASSSSHGAAATVAVAGGARASREREPSGEFEFAPPLAPPNRKAAAAGGEASGSGGGDWLGNLTQPLLVAVMSAGLSSTSPTYEERLM
jgi:fatty acid desaturase